jgi:ferredoxin
VAAARRRSPGNWRLRFEIAKNAEKPGEFTGIGFCTTRDVGHVLARISTEAAEDTDMAMKILEDCISCGACEPECPNEAISQGDTIYLVAVDKCTECVGAFDAPKCVEVCPVDGCVLQDPDHAETREQLQDKYNKMHA